MTHDVAIIGNGAVGLSAAIALRSRDPQLSVIVIGDQRRAASATSAAGAMLGCFGEVTAATLSSTPGRERFEMQLAAHRRWPTYLEAIREGSGRSVPLVAEDTFVLLNAGGGTIDSANFAAMLEALDEFVEPFEEVSEVPGLNPTPDARPLRALHLPAEGAVDSAVLLEALDAWADRLGVERRSGWVSEIEASGGQVRGVRLVDGSQVVAAAVVVAAGAWASPLLDESMQPVLAGSGTALVAERVLGAAPTSVLRSVNRAGSCGLHLVPLGNGLEYIGATNVIFATPEERAHLGVLQFLIDGAVNQIDRMLAYSRIEGVRVGNRPVALDAMPLLGAGPLDGLWVLGGGYRDGLHAAPEIADLLATSLLEGHSAFPATFDPCRRPISTLSREESIAAFVDQHVASLFEGGLNLPPFTDVRDLERMARGPAERLYDRLGTDFGLHPDLVGYLCFSRKADHDVDAIATYLARVSST